MNDSRNVKTFNRMIIMTLYSDFPMAIHYSTRNLE